MKLLTARSKKECDLCEAAIPKGHKYWHKTDAEITEDDITGNQHTNCEQYAPRVTAAVASQVHPEFNSGQETGLTREVSHGV